jgi:uncharacterized protein YjiS (DUF1127 family)
MEIPMATQTTILARVVLAGPRPSWRGLLGRLVALDALFRERCALQEMDARMLRDIGLSRREVAETLSRPDAHLRSILLRGGDQLQR